MAKIDEVKEILNTLRVAMSIIAGVIIVLIGKIFTKFEKNELVIIAEVVVVYNISKKIKEIKEL